MAKAKVVLSNLDKIKNSKNYTDLVFLSIKDLLGSIDNKKPTDIFVFPPYRAGENDSKMKAIYNDIDYDSVEFSRLNSLNEDYNIDTKSIIENLSKVYFNQALTKEKPKYSVSEIKKHNIADNKYNRYGKKNIHNNANTEDISLLEDKKANVDRVDGSELGNMMHSFMEQYDFETPLETYIGINHEAIGVSKIINVGAKQYAPAIHMSEGLPSPIDYIDNIKKFLSSVLGKEVAHAKKNNKLYREQRFMIELPLDTVKNYLNVADTSANNNESSKQMIMQKIGSPSPSVIIQGVIDAFYINDNGNIVLIDYKTDGLSNGNITKEKLISAYKIQLDIYSKALTQLTGKMVESKYLYSFALNDAISF